MVSPQRFFKLLLLRWSQSKSFRGADGVIFLTNYAKQTIESAAKIVPPFSAVIPHGVMKISSTEKIRPFCFSAVSIENPCKLIYVSRVSPYKHQWQVAKAVSTLRDKELYVEIDFIGGTERGAEKLGEAILKFDPTEKIYSPSHGELSHTALAHLYKISRRSGVRFKLREYAKYFGREHGCGVTDSLFQQGAYARGAG